MKMSKYVRQNPLETQEQMSPPLLQTTNGTQNRPSKQNSFTDTAKLNTSNQLHITDAYRLFDPTPEHSTQMHTYHLQN